ncbi:MAG: hypothetical protein CL676_13155 [Bdellovibrionaceae bacterium]|nr:hypothetical protein [Pseudobdellovibrionaceae bacterium]
MQLNAENLFLFLDEELPANWQSLPEKQWQNLSRASVSNKSLEKLKRLASTILEEKPHVVGLNEVGGEESIQNFSKLFLEDLYDAYLVEGNSDRGIDVGYLVLKSWGKKFELTSYKDRPINFLYPHEKAASSAKTSHMFSRDCAELKIFAGEDHKDPEMILFLVHLKSKLDPEGIDPFGNLRRGAEVQTLLEIYKESKEKHPGVPKAVLGDFNGVAREDGHEMEFQGIYQESDLKNALELAKIEGEFYATQVQFSRMGQRTLLQFDYIFLSEELHHRLVVEETFVYRYRNEMGIHSSLPTNFDEKLALPSDHYPVVVTLDFSN